MRKQNETHLQVLSLRRKHSTKEVSILLGIPVGTVKTICSRLGATRDNHKLREFFKLPDIALSANTELQPMVSPPTPTVITGDDELDAVLWLRQVVKTGDTSLIEKAIKASERIKSSEDQLEKKYGNYLMTLPNSNTMMSAFGSIGFANIKGLAATTLSNKEKQRESLSRYGSKDVLFSTLEQETFCIEALSGLPKIDGDYFTNYREQSKLTVEVFSSITEMAPNTLSDCMYELEYWQKLYRLRSCWESYDHLEQVNQREDFLFHCMTFLRPKTREEGVAVFHYLADNDSMNRESTDAILNNLIR